MYPEQQTLRDEVIRQWQPYGLVAAYWADQLVSAMVELDRVQSLNAAQAATIEDEAHSWLGMSNSDYSDEKRMQLARYRAFEESNSFSMKLLLRLNQQAMKRIEQIQRTLNEIRKQTPPAETVAQPQPIAVPRPATARFTPSAPPAPPRNAAEPRPSGSGPIPTSRAACAMR